MGFAEFGSTKGYNKMEALFSLIPRVDKLEQDMMKLSDTLSKVSLQMDRIEKLFNSPKIPDSFKDVT